jgi:organic radical activating enzyme
MSSSFCVVPWVQLSTKPNGNIRICCLMTQSDDQDRGVLRRTDGSIYNARQSDYMTSFNSEKINNLRKDLLRGEQNPLCRACWQKESLGLVSKRQVTNRDLKDEFDINKAQEVTQADGSVDQAPLLYLDLRFGNLCNLKCIMCHPSSSSQWYNDYVALYGKKEFTDTGDRVALQSVNGNYQPVDRSFFAWYEEPSFWEKLESKIDQVKQIYLVGGEPLLIKEHERFLHRCKEMGHASQMILEYDTNLTYLSPQILELWQSFKKVKLRVSIESTGVQNDYIRFPSNWQDIQDNIKKIKELRANIELDFSITWQIYNLFCVTQIWEAFPGLGSVRVLNSPPHLDIRILPASIKERALKHLDSFKTEDHRVQKQIESMKKYLISHHDSENPRLLSEFKEFTHKCDQLRGTQAPNVFPEIKELFL